MSDLIKEVKEAEDYVRETKKEFAKFLKFENEEFEKIEAGVLSLTSKDTQGDTPILSDLEEMKDHINNDILFFNNNHNPEIQPIGRAIHSEIFYSSKSEVHFIVGIIGLYNPSKFTNFSTFGINLDEYECEPDYILNFKGLPSLEAQIGLEIHETPKEVIDEIMLNRPICVSNKVMPVFIKGETTKSFIEIFLTVWLACTNPYSKKVLEELGKRTVDTVFDFLSFLKNNAFKAIQKLDSEDKLQIYRFRVGDTKYSFILNTNELANQEKAIDTFSDSANASMKLVSRFPENEITECVYKFDNKLKKWMPFYIISKTHGIIIDSPTLISLDSLPTGISVGGIGVLGDFGEKIEN